jgi:hypothetical protein
VEQYSRCYQLLGFDILLDRRLKPWVLEVNYQPSLDYHGPAERRMKIGMLVDLLRIALPDSPIRDALRARKWAWTGSSWAAFVKENESVLHDAVDRRQMAVDIGKFVPVCPPSGSLMRDVLLRVYKTVQRLASCQLPQWLSGNAPMEEIGSQGERIRGGSKRKGLTLSEP